MASHIGNRDPALAINRLLYLEVPFLVLRSAQGAREAGNVRRRAACGQQLLYRQAVIEGWNSQRRVPAANGIHGVANGSRGARRITPSHRATSYVRPEQIDPYEVGNVDERVSNKRRKSVIENSEAAAYHCLVVVPRRPGKAKARSEIDAVHRAERISSTREQRLIVGGAGSLRFDLVKRRVRQSETVDIAGGIEIVFCPQSKCQLESGLHRPLLLRIDAQTTRVHRCSGMQGVVLRVDGGASGEEITHASINERSRQLRCVVVGNIVAPKVDSHLQVVSSKSLGKIIHQLPLGYIAARRESIVQGI